jgi:putative aldouronate transport system permease protein
MVQTNQPRTRIRVAPSTVVFQCIGYLLVGLVALTCVLPFIMLVSASFSSEQAITLQGFGLLPREFNLKAYEMVFKYPEDILRAYGVSIFVTGVGTVVGLLITAMTAYVLSRANFRYRNAVSFFFYFTTLFSGGMVTTYIFVVRYLNLKDNYLSLIFPMMINVFYLLIMRSFMRVIPTSLIESAKIDGAGEWRIFFQMILPLSTASLATIGLFIALGYWNDWYSAMLYMSSREKWPLQYMLYNMLASAQAMTLIAAKAGLKLVDMPSQSLRMAMAVVATGPAILLYPFVQKYFVKGVTIGAVKG